MFVPLKWAPALVLLLSSVALAQEAGAADPRAEAAAAYSRGVKLFESGQAAKAVAEFRQAYSLAPNYKVLFNLGVAASAAGDPVEAATALDRYLREGGPAVSADRRETVERELNGLRRQLVEVSVAVEGGPARLSVDGAGVGATPLAQPLLLLPGRHAVKAERDGAEPAEQQFEGTGGTRLSLLLAPKPKAATMPAAPGRLSIDSRPADAFFVVDGYLHGRAPWTGPIAPGVHVISGQLKGYPSAKEVATVASGEERSVLLDFGPPLPVSEAKVSRGMPWYGWTAIVVGTASVVGLGIYWMATRPDVRTTVP